MVATITNYTDRHVRNNKDQFENSNGDFLRECKKRGRKKKIGKSGGLSAIDYLQR